MGQAEIRGWLDFSGLHQEGVIHERQEDKSEDTDGVFKEDTGCCGFRECGGDVFTFIMIWRTCDLSPLAYLIPAVAAETATGTGFYYAKAKVENRIKLMKLYKVEPTEQSFNEQGGYYNG